MDRAELRIRDLAVASLLDRSRLLAGRAGLDRPVERVVVRDVGPGTRLQVRAGDLVVARRAGIPGGGEGRQLVARLASGGAAGLVFVDGHYLPGALAGVRHAADEEHLPLFALPRGVEAGDAAAALEAVLAGGGAAAAARAVHAAASLARATTERGVPGAVAALADATGLGVQLQDADGRRQLAVGRIDARPVATHPVAGGELSLHGAAAGALAEPLLAHAAALVELELARGDPATAARDRREADEVRRFLGGGDGPAAIVVALAAGEPALAGRLRERLGAVCGAVDDDLVALLSPDTDPDRIGQVAEGAAWGASAPGGDGPRGLREARAARELGPVLGRRPVFGEVRVADALVRSLGPDGTSSLAADVLDQLPPELLATLAAYLETGLSVAGTADLLYVHKNTVRYRLRRLETLTGKRFARLGDRLELEAAVIAKLLKDRLEGGSRPGR